MARPPPRPPPAAFLRVENAHANNLKKVKARIPAGRLTCITGVSGAGKSSLLFDVLQNAAEGVRGTKGKVKGLDRFGTTYVVDQLPIGTTPASNPATYTKALDPIRDLFAMLPEARVRGFDAGRFSFNRPGGRCEACEGRGAVKVEMHFLADVWVPCDECRGRRYNRETLEIQYKGRNIHEILQLTVEQALEFFAAVPAVARKLRTLADVGLGYITLGQSAITLSGGEAQRVKLSLELSKRETGRTLYILDEPTTGLHFHDIELLLHVLHRLCDEGNTVVVIEHNLDVIKTADWIVDLGPEGGAGGGRIVARGTPEQVAADPASHTGRYLRRVLRLTQPSAPAPA
jgi:excinuclease ABC subunit A